MKRTIVVALAIVGMLAIISSSPTAQSTDEDALRHELAQVFDSLANGNVEFFNGHYVPEVSRFHLGGVPLDIGWDADKAAGVANYFDQGWRINTESYDVADLRIYGEFAVTAGTALATETTVFGVTERRDFRFTYVWMKRDGQWKELHHHVSPYVRPESGN